MIIRKNSRVTLDSALTRNWLAIVWEGGEISFPDRLGSTKWIFTSPMKEHKMHGVRIERETLRELIKANEEQIEEIVIFDGPKERLQFVMDNSK